MKTNEAKSLNRFIDAQESVYDKALSEIRAGKKTSHWMWFIFPQIKGLGKSHVAEYYGIEIARFSETINIFITTFVAVSILLYNIHRLRDIQYNENDGSKKKDFLLNACDEIEKYVIPLVNDKNLNKKVH